MLLSIRTRLIERPTYQELVDEFHQMGVDSRGIKLMAPKGKHFLLKIEGLSARMAIILKQEALSTGGEAALPREAISFPERETSALLMGTEKQLRQVARKLQMQPFQLPQLGNTIREILSQQRQEKPTYLELGPHQLDWRNKTITMGILNVTPDSFSDGGKFHNIEIAVNYALDMQEEGAEIIDVGGESTRPGAVPISAEKEADRVLPVIRELREKLTVPISIDTYKASTAEKALKEGAHMINDVWGGKADPDILGVAADYQVPVCLMHNRTRAAYQDLLREIGEDLQESVEMALAAGVSPENIILDPGIGFGKNLEHNLEVMRRLEEIKALGYPLLLGTSRKSMIGKVLDLPLEERIEGTAATVACGIAKGVDIVRVHDVKAMKRVIRMTDAMIRR